MNSTIFWDVTSYNQVKVWKNVLSPSSGSKSLNKQADIWDLLGFWTLFMSGILKNVDNTTFREKDLSASSGEGEDIYTTESLRGKQVFVSTEYSSTLTKGQQVCPKFVRT
jgi:hypothetical protein